MTFRVPFGVITVLLSSIVPMGNVLVDRAVFMDGLKTAYLGLAALNTLALIPALAGVNWKNSPCPKLASASPIDLE